MSSPERPSKQQAFLALLKEGWTSLHLDARRTDVLVPESFRSEAHLILQYGHDLPIPIPDLEIDQDGVRATLSFSRAAHTTYVPWSAVYAVTGADGRGVLFAEDVPSDVSVIAAPVSERYRRPRCAACSRSPPTPSRSRTTCSSQWPRPPGAAAAAGARSSAWSSRSGARRRPYDGGTTASARNLASSSWWSRASS
jgi:stringent starvation protein B